MMPVTIRAAITAVTMFLPAVAAAQLPTPPSPWTAPAGIPAPPFGITEVAGTATHYVDENHPSATDTSNPNGSPTIPRKTVPTSLAAGSVVEVHSGNYAIGNFTVTWTASGTSTSAVFIKGVGWPVFYATGASSKIQAAGSYFIIEGIILYGLPINTSSTMSRFALRKSVVTEFSPSSNASAVAVDGTDIVIFGNEIDENGDASAQTERDITGVFAMPGSENVWIVDNHIHHNGGDAVLVGAATSSNPWAESIYIGRNVLHEDRENGVDVKQSRNVILSTNLIYGYVTRDSSLGEAIIVHNGPEAVWVINNLVASSNLGIVCSEANFYVVVGNEILNIRHDPAVSYSPTNLQAQGSGILTYGTVDSIHFNNTLWGNDAGISYLSGTEPTFIVNNIIAELQETTHHIGVSSTTAMSASYVKYNILDATPRVSVSGVVSGCSAFPNCISADPDLDDPASGDFDLLSSSPAIDAADPDTGDLFALFEVIYSFPLDSDIVGGVRPDEEDYDIGSREFQGGSLQALAASIRRQLRQHAITGSTWESSPAPLWR